MSKSPCECLDSNPSWSNLTTTEGEAVPEEVLEHLGEADIHEHGPVELVVVRLVDDVESVVKVLAGEEGVQ